MIALACSLAAFITALLVNRKVPTYRGVASVLFAGAMFSAYSMVPSADERLLLVLLGSISFATMAAYMALWGKHEGYADILALFGAWFGYTALVMFAPNPDAWWPVAIWAPILGSVAIGSVLLWQTGPSLMLPQRKAAWIDTRPQWWREGYEEAKRLDPKGTRHRPAAIASLALCMMLMGDSTGLLFLRWLPAALPWQGRVQALLLTALQVGWLIRDWRRTCK